MHRKDLPSIILDDYFEKVKSFTREAVRAEYNLGAFFLKLWFWWLSSEEDDKSVVIEKETAITKQIKESQTQFTITGKNSGVIPFQEEELDIFLQPEKINKFSFYVISPKKSQISEEVVIALKQDRETSALPGRIIRADVVKLQESYKYEIATGFDTVKKAAAAKKILTYLKLKSS